MNPVAPFSVLLSVYDKNLPNQLDQAIKSIWYDQKLKPAQVVIVEDGRLSRELESVIDYWSNLHKDVFTIVKLSNNQGLAAALNQGISYCRYNLIARMDADDVSLPDRFIRQYNYMIHHPEIEVLGGQIEEWDEKLEKRLAQKFLPLSDNELKFFTKYRCPFNHPTVMYRKDVVCQVGGYKNKKLEDNYLWINLMLNGSKFANLNFILVKMRADEMIIKNMERDKYTSVIHEELNKLGLEFARYKERWDKLARSIQTVNKDVENVSITTDKISRKFDSINRVEVGRIEDKNE